MKMDKDNKLLIINLFCGMMFVFVIMIGIVYLVDSDSQGKLNPPELNKFCLSKGGDIGGVYGSGMSCWINEKGVDVQYQVFKHNGKIKIRNVNTIKPLW